MSSDTIDDGVDIASVPSGRFVLRISPGLHATLRQAAKRAGLSLNDYCARTLAASGSDPTGPGAEAVQRALGQFGPGLLGMVIYGSWARGEATDRSDVDLLVVLARELSITRDLYRVWDESPTWWQSGVGTHLVEPHFTHLPDSGGRISGIWAEVAAEGIVAFERGQRLSLTLVALRRRILDGEFIRRHAHGHPYWVEAA